VPAIVAINSFPTDTPAEVEAIREVALAAGARDAVVATHFVDGGNGAATCRAVWDAASSGEANFRSSTRTTPPRREDPHDRDPGLRADGSS